MKKIIATVSIILATGAQAQTVDPLSGHHEVTGFWDKFVCRGAGTCMRDSEGRYRKACTDPQRPCAPTARYGGAFTPSTVTVGPTNYVIVPDYSTGQISAIIPSGR